MSSSFEIVALSHLKLPQSAMDDALNNLDPYGRLGHVVSLVDYIHPTAINSRLVPWWSNDGNGIGKMDIEDYRNYQQWINALITLVYGPNHTMVVANAIPDDVLADDLQDARMAAHENNANNFEALLAALDELRYGNLEANTWPAHIEFVGSDHVLEVDYSERDRDLTISLGKVRYREFQVTVSKITVVEGLFGNLLVDSLNFGPASFFDAAGIFYWDGYEKIALLGSIQSWFAGLMYILMFLWTPALSPNDEDILRGFIFATFVLATMLGSSIAARLLVRNTLKVESHMQMVFAISSASVLVRGNDKCCVYEFTTLTCILGVITYREAKLQTLHKTGALQNVLHLHDVLARVALGKFDNSERIEERAAGWYRLCREILKLSDAPHVKDSSSEAKDAVPSKANKDKSSKTRVLNNRGWLQKMKILL
ncbi:hypothetical protein BUALT_BualtUnG0005900 [Buddleja alternifolia]|uniref:Uncharacterized protein n=1 Tax=Buddleja alternifolia TaxID=168488 RepID=A0AAV6W804_9LAMI|nr:hypothetical protein BUALT_BualtUnG0005900 [Buddleja alternifolia]